MTTNKIKLGIVGLLVSIATAILINYFIFFKLPVSHWNRGFIIRIIEWFHQPVGVVIAIICIGLIIYLKINPGVKLVYTLFVTGIITILATVVIFYLFSLTVGDAGFFENEPAIYYYNIEVKGLDNYTSFGITDIIVPMPMKNGEQVFSDEELQYQSFGDWGSVLVATKEGKMLAFQTTKTNLSDINASFKKYVNYSIDAENTLEDILLYPVSNETAVYYTTYVYIDQKIQPKLSDNNSINLKITLHGEEEMIYGKRISQYIVDVHENIPDGTTGPIPVKAWIYWIAQVKTFDNPK